MYFTKIRDKLSYIIIKLNLHLTLTPSIMCFYHLHTFYQVKYFFKKIPT